MRRLPPESGTTSRSLWSGSIASRTAATSARRRHRRLSSKLPRSPTPLFVRRSSSISRRGSCRRAWKARSFAWRRALMEPVDTDDVAEARAKIAAAPPLNGTVELAGSEAICLNELARLVPNAQEDPAGRLLFVRVSGTEGVPRSMGHAGFVLRRDVGYLRVALRFGMRRREAGLLAARFPGHNVCSRSRGRRSGPSCA